MERANEVSDLLALELSPTLVLVLTCLTIPPLVYLPTIALLLLKFWSLLFFNTMILAEIVRGVGGVVYT